MGDGDEFDFERTDRHHGALRDDLERNFRRAGFVQTARLQQAGGEARRIDLDAKARPEFGKRADMILMRMGDDDADEVFLDLFDEFHVRQDQIDARQVVAGEGHADIDQQPFALLGGAEAIERAIHADLAKTAKRREDQFVLFSHLDRCFLR